MLDVKSTNVGKVVCPNFVFMTFGLTKYRGVVLCGGIDAVSAQLLLSVGLLLHPNLASGIQMPSTSVARSQTSAMAPVLARPCSDDKKYQLVCMTKIFSKLA